MNAQLPVFPVIVGCGRSGTTLLRAMLDAGPDLHIPPESRFIPTLLDHRAELEQRDGVDIARVLDLLEENEHYRHWGLPPRDDVHRWLAAESPKTVPELVRALFRLHADRAGKARYGDKSPPYVMQIPRLAATFPEAKFVHLVRDGRDVCLAYLDAPFGPQSVAELALHWRLRVMRGRRAGDRLGPDRYREVRYEDLVAEPESVLRDLASFIDVDFVLEMLDHRSRVAGIVEHDRQPENHTRLSQPVTKGLRNWRRDLDPSDVAAFELLAGDALRTFGYDLSSRRRLTTAARVIPEALSWYLRRLSKRVRQ